MRTPKPQVIWEFGSQKKKKALFLFNNMNSEFLAQGLSEFYPRNPFLLLLRDYIP